MVFLLAVSGGAALVMGGVSVQGATVGMAAYQETRIEGATFPKQLIDPLGLRQTVPAPPHRIASAVLVGDEILTALVPAERFVAVSRLIDDPAISNCVQMMPAAVERISPDIETLLRLEPDLVAVAGYTRPEAVRLLVSIGIPVLRFGQYDTFAEVMANVQTAGAVVGAEAEAAAIVADMERRIAAVQQRVAGRPQPRVLYYLPGGFTSGRDTLIDEALALAGGVNVAREAGIVGENAISVELAIGLEPDVLLLPSWRPPEEDPEARAFLHEPVWQSVPAVRTGRVYEVNSAWTYSLSQHSVHGLEHVARILHPEAFDS